MNLFITTVLGGVAGATVMQALRAKTKTRGSFLNYFNTTTGLIAAYTANYSPCYKIAYSVLMSMCGYYQLYHDSTIKYCLNAPYHKIISTALLQIPFVFMPLPIAVVGNIAISYAVEYLENKYKLFSRVFVYLPDFSKGIDQYLTETAYEYDKFALLKNLNIYVQQAGIVTAALKSIEDKDAIAPMLQAVDGLLAALESFGVSSSSSETLVIYLPPATPQGLTALKNAHKGIEDAVANIDTKLTSLIHVKPGLHAKLKVCTDAISVLHDTCDKSKGLLEGTNNLTQQDVWCNKLIFKGVFDLNKADRRYSYLCALQGCLISLPVVFLLDAGMRSAFISLEKSFQSYCMVYGFNLVASGLAHQKKEGESYGVLFTRTSLYVAANSALQLMLGKSIIKNLIILIPGIMIAHTAVDKLMSYFINPANPTKEIPSSSL